MTVYYNEIDPYAAQWLRNLIEAELIPKGDVDERDIRDVRPDDLVGYTQCHFFAGIGGWPLALQIAGINSPVWTGSPPCQDNSVAAAVHGRRTGLEGARSGLAKTWLNLVERVKPCTVLFENVPGIRPWFSYITESLGRSGYSISESESSSKGIGAPHIRKRVWAIANRRSAGLAFTRQPKSQAPYTDPRTTAPGNYWIETERGFRPLDDGLPGRVAQIRAFGNAIDPWAAAEFISAYMEAV